MGEKPIVFCLSNVISSLEHETEAALNHFLNKVCDISFRKAMDEAKSLPPEQAAASLRTKSELVGICFLPLTKSTKPRHVISNFNHDNSRFATATITGQIRLSFCLYNSIRLYVF